MNKEIMKACGFANEVKRVENGLCPFCCLPINVKMRHLKKTKMELLKNETEEELYYQRLQGFAAEGWNQFLKSFPKDKKLSEINVEYAKKLFKIGYVFCILGIFDAKKCEEKKENFDDSR